MQVTDSFVDHVTPTQALRQYTTESMTIHNGPMAYTQSVHFHTYDVYRHGKHQIHSRSVGYSSDGDIVMTREDVSSPSDADMGFIKRQTTISDPTVLDASARRPLTDSELTSKHKIRINRPRYKKYPGIFTPKNRKMRNRLLNDYFVNPAALKILEEVRERHQHGDYDDAPSLRPSFADLPPAVLNAFDMKDDDQRRELERLGINVTGTHTNYIQAPRDPDSAEARYQGLNSRLRGELQHALNSEFLSQQIEDLEVSFSELIHRGPTAESLVYHFRDGYGRLVCHGVAAYYQLTSESRVTSDGLTKYTYVSFPHSKRAGIRDLNLPHVPLIKVLRGNRSTAPGRHPLSVVNTPLQEACPEPILNPMDGALEPMSPLDLNENVTLYPTAGGITPPTPPEEPPASSSLLSSPTCVSGRGVFPSHAMNGAMVMTVGGRILPNHSIPVYAPHLRLPPVPRQEAPTEVMMVEASPEAPEFLTATQRKKLKKAAKVAASQENTPVLEPQR